ncbi:MAG TPA: tetratricopeptide repeat protein [bacterium]
MKRILLVLALTSIPAMVLATTTEEFYSAGLTLFQQKDYPKALQYFQEAVKERPGMWQAYQYIGESYYQMANVTAALMAMQESLKLHPDNPGLRQFVEKVKKDSPWASSGPIKDKLPFVSIVLSFITLLWVLYLTFWIPLRDRRKLQGETSKDGHSGQ